MQEIALFFIWYLVFVFSATCHEAAHALVAMRGGDDTAYALGHVTLDPMPHIRREPMGMVLVPILTFLQWHYVMGWASVPYNPHWGARHPKRRALMSLAGPTANFALAALALVLIHVFDAVGVFDAAGEGVMAGLVRLPAGYAINSFLGAAGLCVSVLLELNLILGLFNLIPLPPLDGASVLEGLGPPALGRVYERFRQAPMLQLLGLLAAWSVFPSLYLPVQGLVYRLL